MDNDDRQLGHILSRREVLALLGTAGIAILAGCGPTQSGAAQRHLNCATCMKT